MDLEALLPIFENFGYLGIFFGLLACGLGLPVPEEVFLIGGGILVYTGHTTFLLTSIVAMISILIGDSLAFFLGKYHAHRIYKIKLLGKLLGSEKKLSWVQSHFDAHALKTIFFARFLAGVRAPTFFFAGGHGVAYWKFLLMNGLAALLSVPTSIWIAWVLGENIEEAKKTVHEFHIIILAVIVVAVLVGVAWYFWRKKRKSEAV